MATDAHALLRLQSWLSPGFPVGAYSYSHGLEYAVEAGFVRNGAQLVDWLEADLRYGAGWCDGVILVAGYRAADRDDEAGLAELAELAAARLGSRELALESLAQGRAFLRGISAAWPHRQLSAHAGRLAQADLPVVYPLAVALACAAHAVPLEAATQLFLQATTANLVNAGVRLIPLGQSDGQRAVAALEPAVLTVAEAALVSTADDLGTAAVMVDWASMQHETQYTRLFRS